MPDTFIPSPELQQSSLRYQSSIKRMIVTGGFCFKQKAITVFDIFAAMALLISLSPWWLLLSAKAYIGRGRILDREVCLGRDGKRFFLYRFACDCAGSHIARLFNVITGDLALVGPAPQRSANAERLQVSPGIFSLYRLRQSVRMAHAGESDIEREYIYRQGLKANLGILLRYLIGSLLGGKVERPTPEHIDFFGIQVRNKTMQQAVVDIERLARAESQTHVAFVNPDCLNISWKNDDYRAVLKRSTYVLPDGIGLQIGCRLQKVALKANVNGTDLFPQLCEQLQHSDLKLFLLGARPGIADATASNMMHRFPGLNICGTQHGYFEPEQTTGVINLINASGADIVLVAMGAPGQELWIDQYRDQLDARVLMGVGGLFDFYSGRISRAPVWVREIGMEWVWRILQEPGRMWKRYVIGNPLFLYRVWRYGKQQSIQHENELSMTGLVTLDQDYLWRRLRRQHWHLAGRLSRFFKRSLDVSVAALMLLLLLPLFLLVAAAIRLESPGPILFSQQRVGERGRQFNFWKFRSMYVDAEKRKAELMSQNEMQGGVLFKMKHDPRITRVGRFIRRASIDELPQLWNVLRGDMSLVGPRPCLPTEIESYSIEDRNRLDALPGLTCTWQVSGRSDIPFEQQVQMDVEYIHQSGLLQDLRLMFKTIPAIISGRGAY